MEALDAYLNDEITLWELKELYDMEILPDHEQQEIKYFLEDEGVLS